MQKPLQITLRNISPSSELDAYIRGKAQKLESFFSRITGCRVTLDLQHAHDHKKGQFCHVSVEIDVPQETIVMNHNHHDGDFYIAVRYTFDAATRKLEDYSQRHQGKQG
jgi:ribosomal subunit interface protein